MSVPAPRQSWEEDIVLVTGYGRTGTTLMQGLLCSSEDVMGVTPEAKLLEGLIIAYMRGLSGWKPYTSDLFSQKADYQGFMRGLLGLYLGRLRGRTATGRRLLQRVPGRVAAAIAEIAIVLPNAQFVVMVRDPRAAIASKAEFNRRYGKRLDPATAITDFVAIYRRIAQLLPSLKDRMTLVRYERLVTDPAPVMAELAAFLSIRLPADPDGLAWENKRAKTLAEASPLDGQPISTASLTKYRTTLNPKVLALLEDQRHEIERRIGLPVFHDAQDQAGARNPT